MCSAVPYGRPSLTSQRKSSIAELVGEIILISHTGTSLRSDTVLLSVTLVSRDRICWQVVSHCIQSYVSPIMSAA